MLISTGQGILGNNMFAYCRNNPVIRYDVRGYCDSKFKEKNDDEVETAPDPNDGGGGGGSGTSTVGTAPSGGSSGAGVQVSNNNGQVNIPKNAYDIRAYVNSHNGTPPKGYKGGGTFLNDGRGTSSTLPPSSAPFKEYDIYPRVAGGRGAERIVIGADGRAWYTPDHYKTFWEMR